MPQRIRDLGVAALALAALVAGIVAIDDRVPSQLRQMATDVGNGQWMAPGTAVGSALASVSASPAANNTIVGAFVLAAVVLVVLMVRS
jgi:hypothetical protein